MFSPRGLVCGRPHELGRAGGGTCRPRVSARTGTAGELSAAFRPDLDDHHAQRSSANPVTSGQNVTFTAVVGTPPGAGTPDGEVEFGLAPLPYLPTMSRSGRLEASSRLRIRSRACNPAPSHSRPPSLATPTSPQARSHRSPRQSIRFPRRRRSSPTPIPRHWPAGHFHGVCQRRADQHVTDGDGHVRGRQCLATSRPAPYQH